MTVSVEKQNTVVLCWKTNFGLVSDLERGPCLLGVDPPALKASGGTQHSGATSAQTALQEIAGEILVGVALLRPSSAAALSPILELCCSPAPAQPCPCWSQPWSPHADLPSDVSSHKGSLVRKGKLLSRRKKLLKNIDRLSLGVLGPCQGCPCPVSLAGTPAPSAPFLTGQPSLAAPRPLSLVVFG